MLHFALSCAALLGEGLTWGEPQRPTHHTMYTQNEIRRGTGIQAADRKERETNPTNSQW